MLLESGCSKEDCLEGKVSFLRENFHFLKSGLSTQALWAWCLYFDWWSHISVYIIFVTLMQSSKLHRQCWSDCRHSFTNTNFATILNLSVGKYLVVGLSLYWQWAGILTEIWISKLFNSCDQEAFWLSFNNFPLFSLGSDFPVSAQWLSFYSLKLACVWRIKKNSCYFFLFFYYLAHFKAF